MVDGHDRQPVTEPSRRSRRFGFGLFAFLILTVVLFDLVRRWMPRIARQVGGIENGWLQFSIYFAIYVVLMLIGMAVVRRVLRRQTTETLLRLIFAGGATLSFAVAYYQNQFGTGLSATYLTVGILGAFAGVLIITHRYWGLVEVNSQPPPEVVEEVRRGHRAIVLADTPWDRVKRTVEFVLALVMIVVSLPISIILSMITWFQDPGPLLLAKVVIGRGGCSFRQLKLRTMIKDAEQSTGTVPAAPADARVTALGRLLRPTHIDELPQVLNVLAGQMSLVGPRPDRTVFARRNLRTLPRYAERHAVRPGIAGMAAVFGDNYSVPREKLRYDLLYIRRRSFALDLWLLVSATLLAFLNAGPAARRGRRAFNEARRDARWRAAYAALHGGTPEPPVARATMQRPEPAPPTKIERLPEAEERTTVS